MKKILIFSLTVALIIGSISMVLPMIVPQAEEVRIDLEECNPLVDKDGDGKPDELIPQVEIDWSYCDLRGASLQQMDLMNANFTGADLSGANLSYANLEDAIFTNAKLLGSNLEKANLNNADFTNATLTGARLYGSTLQNTDFKNAELQFAELILTMQCLLGQI